MLIKVLLLVLSAASVAFGQETGTTITPDNRYEGYTGPTIVWPTTAPNCTGQEYYEPKFTSLYRKMVNVAGERIQEHDECTWMYTVSGWTWALRRAGTKVATDAQGRDLFDLGRADGKVCGNPRITPPPPKPVPPPPPENGRIHVTKKVLDYDSVGMRVPTGVFSVQVGPYIREIGSDGEVEISVPPGTYPISEIYDEKVWVQVYLSATEVTVKSGETVNVEIKNQQLRPEPQKPAHICPENCATVAAMLNGYAADLGRLTYSTDMKLALLVRWEGVKILGVYTPSGDLWFEGDHGIVTAAHFSGTGVYEGLEIRGEDSEGHELVCTFGLTLVPPAPHKPIVKKPPKKGRKVPIPCIPREKTKFGIIVPMAECAIIAGVAWWLWPVAALVKIAPVRILPPLLKVGVMF